MTAVSQNLTFGSATAPIGPLPETSSADAVGVTADALFLQIMDQNVPGLLTFDAPQTVLPTVGTASASTTLPILSDLEDDQPVVDAAGLSPLAQNFSAVPLPFASTRPPGEGVAVQAKATEPAHGKPPVDAGATLSAPLSSGGAAETVGSQFPDNSAQAMMRDGLGASQSPAKSPGPPQAISPAFESTPSDPARVAVSMPLVVVPASDQAIPKTATQIFPSSPDRPLPLLAKISEVPDHPAQTKRALTAHQPDHPLDGPSGGEGVSARSVVRGDAAENSAKQGDSLQLLNVIPTSAESAWRQKWIGVSADGSSPAFANATLRPELHAGAGIASIASNPEATSAATGASNSNTALPPTSAALALPTPAAPRNAPPAPSGEKPSLPLAKTAFSDQDASPTDLLSNSEGSSVLTLDPVLRTASKDPQITASVPTAPPILTPVIVELARSGNDGPIDLALAPEELGRLTISIRQEGDFVHVSMMAERPETLDLLRRHAGDLLADLRQSGFSGASFSFGQGGQDRSSQTTDTSLGTDDAAAPHAAPHDFKQPSPHRAHTGAGLDLRI